MALCDVSKVLNIRESALRQRRLKEKGGTIEEPIPKKNWGRACDTINL